MLFANISNAEAHVGKFHCSKALELIVMGSKKQNFREIFLTFTKLYFQFTSK